MEARYLIVRAVQQFSDRRAVYEPKGESFTFQELNARANRLARGLLSVGLKKGDKVGVLMPNCRQYLEAYLALAKTGLVRVSMNFRLSPREHGYMLADSESRAVIVAEEFLDRILTIKPELKGLNWVIGLKSDGKKEVIPYEALLAGSSPEEPEGPIDPEDVFRLHYTSGTTGLPKAAVQTHASRYITTLNTLLDVVNFSPDDKVLHVAPLTHASGNLFLPSFIRGASNILLGKFDPSLFLRTVQDEGITTVFLAPTMIVRILGSPDLKEYDLSTLKTILYGGAPMPLEKLQEALEALGDRFVQIYGLAEATWADTVLTKDDHRNRQKSKLGSIGRELTNVRIKLLNESGLEANPGEIGEICIRGHHLMREYWKRPEATATSLKDGFFHTGDLGRIDKGGYITVVDRKGEMIISGGFNVYPKEVEDVIYMNPGILEAAVFAVPDPEWGEAVKAAILLKEGVRLSEEEIILHCQEYLASYKKPRSIEFWTEPLPKNSAGKILRRAIREKYWQGMDRRVH